MSQRRDDTTERVTPPPPPPRGQSLRLYTAAGPVVLELPVKGAVTLGRGGDVDLLLEAASISRRHARIHVDGAVHVEDLGSANGTRVRGVTLRPGERVELDPGDLVEFAGVVGTLRSEGDALVEGDAAVALDPEMVRLYALVDQLAPSDLPLLVVGETGVGKEVLASRIHARSERAARPMVRLNCAALTEALVESELFGHEKGAFTGAWAARQGLFEAASGGTLLLDEVGELTPAMQAKLLRALDDKRVRRVGSNRELDVDVRVVAATNRDLSARVAEGRFRGDLYFRLNGCTLRIPPLRERPGEVEALAVHFLRAQSQRRGHRPPQLTPEAVARLRAHRWPGNVRELRNVVERAMLLARGGAVDVQHLLFDELAPEVAPRHDERAHASLRAARDAAERQRVVDALAEAKGNQTLAAKLLGVSRRTLVDRLGAFGLPRPRKPT